MLSRRRVALGAAVVGVVALVSVIVWRQSIAGWAARQVVRVVNTHLVADLGFERFEFHAPDEIVFINAALTATDGTDVVRLGAMRVRFAEPPKRGRPIQIAELEITGGAVNLVRDPATGELKGLLPFVKPPKQRESELSAQDGPSARLSDVLRLREIKFSGLRVVFDPGDARPVMTLDALAADMVISPEPENPGAYALRLDSGRAPGLVLLAKGELDLDQMAARLDELRLSLDVTPESVASLPPALQTLLRTVNAAGELDIAGFGQIPLTDPTSGRMQVHVGLTGFLVEIGDFRVPIDRLNLEVALEDRRCDLSALEAVTLDGVLTASGHVDLTPTALPAEVIWQGEDLDLALLESARGKGKLVTGRLATSGAASADLADPMATFSGSGEVHLTKATLLRLPGLAQLADLAGTVLPKDVTGGNHRANATFELTPDAVQITDSDVVTTFLAARATGRITYDGTLDLLVRAGPLEKLQNMLGAVGDIFASITDRLVSYSVKGPIDNPSVTVRPLNIGE